MWQHEFVIVRPCYDEVIFFINLRVNKIFSLVKTANNKNLICRESKSDPLYSCYNTTFKYRVITGLFSFLVNLRWYEHYVCLFTKQQQQYHRTAVCYSDKLRWRYWETIRHGIILKLQCCLIILIRESSWGQFFLNSTLENDQNYL